MAQLFHRSMNTVFRAAIFGGALALPATGAALALFYRLDYATGAHTAHVQPVPFSHAHHVAQLGIDCRYCHTSVETAAFAGLPSTKTCMNCHQQIWVGADVLAPVRESYRTGRPVEWRRVHNTPGFVYFDHSAHVAKGVGCSECHGRVDRMPLTWQTGSLLMEWCLDCHRRPERRLRPREEVFNMNWPTGDREAGRRLAEEYGVRGPEVLTSCSTCHR